MKNFFGALTAAALFCTAQSASALIIQAQLTGFESTPQTIQGVATGGGRGTFSLLGADSPVPTSLANILDASFQAVCLEPNSYVTVGQTYNFLVTDLAFAPTTTGGMGAVREGIIETVLGRTGLTSVEDMSLGQVGAATAILYEAGYETAINPLDFASGTAVITGTGTALGTSLLTSVDPQLFNVDAFALVNLGLSGSVQTRSVFEGQDFMVFNASAVPSPGVLALIGIGLLGMVRLRRA